MCYIHSAYKLKQSRALLMPKMANPLEKNILKHKESDFLKSYRDPRVPKYTQYNLCYVYDCVI